MKEEACTHTKKTTWTSVSLSALLLVLAGAVADYAASETAVPISTQFSPPSIEDYATIESMCDGVPVYSFSNICYVYGISPDLLPEAE